MRYQKIQSYEELSLDLGSDFARFVINWKTFFAPGWTKTAEQCGKEVSEDPEELCCQPVRNASSQ